jgi:hypothetical protein
MAKRQMLFRLKIVRKKERKMGYICHHVDMCHPLIRNVGVGMGALEREIKREREREKERERDEEMERQRECRRVRE